MTRIRRAALALALSATFYLLLIDTVSAPELYVLAGVALLATVAFDITREQGFTEAAIRIEWLLRAWRPVVRVPVQIAIVCREAIAQLLSPKAARGGFRAIPFRGGEDERDHGRRALTESLGSLAPNTIVLGVDPDRELLLVHQLHREGGGDELDVLRLG
jgi:multisubunit Na+/H+ antiporter MnhE subunit